MLSPLRNPYAGPVDYAELAQAVPSLAPLSVNLPPFNSRRMLTHSRETACDRVETDDRR